MRVERKARKGRLKANLNSSFPVRASLLVVGVDFVEESGGEEHPVDESERVSFQLSLSLASPTSSTPRWFRTHSIANVIRSLGDLIPKRRVRVTRPLD